MAHTMANLAREVGGLTGQDPQTAEAMLLEVLVRLVLEGNELSGPFARLWGEGKSAMEIAAAVRLAAGVGSYAVAAGLYGDLMTEASKYGFAPGELVVEMIRATQVKK